jgi:hypothetical protein
MKQLVLIVATILVATSIARAQPADSGAAGKVLVARRLYDEGVEAVNKGRWSLAHDRFKASYELAPRVLTLFNLAGSQAQTSRLVEAAESYRRFLRETTDGRYPELRADATTQLEALEKQIAQMTVEITNVDGADLILIDDVEYPHSALREPIPMNPGPHEVKVQRDGAAIANQNITLAPGAADTVPIQLAKKPPSLAAPRPALQPPVSGVAIDGKTDEPPPRRSVFRSPWLWGAVAVVVAGGVAGAYLLTRSNTDVLVVR